MGTTISGVTRTHRPRRVHSVAWDGGSSGPPRPTGGRATISTPIAAASDPLAGRAAMHPASSA
eukprot:9962061-Lingulodinium_polyedra.AAC.1